MGRKSLARQRRAQILDAFEECIVREGLDGASIAKVAEVAEMDRTLIHHYFGNREALEAALVERAMASYKGARDAAVASLPDEDRLSRLLDYLFSEEFNHSRLDVVFDELWSASNRNASTRALLCEAYQEFEQIARAELEKAYPRAPAANRRQVAFSIMCLAEASTGFVGLGFPEARLRAARASAEALLRTLEPAAA